MDQTEDILARELAYHETLYAGFAQQHFAKAAVRALRAHMVRHVLRVTGAARQSRVLSLGCGIGDTELLLARQVSEVVAVDLSPAAIEQARADAERTGVRNVHFVEGTADTVDGAFDLVMAIFFLHHLPDAALATLPGRVSRLLMPGGMFYSLDPSHMRLTGAAGRLLVPALMRKYQSPDERELDSRYVDGLFAGAGYESRRGMYDFVSSPLAGLFPSWRSGYAMARAADELLIRTPLLRRFGSNFEIIARKPR